MKVQTPRQSLLDALLYERPGLAGQWSRWKTLASLSGVDRRRVRFIADLIRSPKPAKVDVLKAANLLRMLGFLNDAVRLLRKHKAFEEAGEVLLVAGRTQEAARCYEAVGKFSQAASLYESKQKFADAARCYDNAGLPSAAAICYAKDGKYAAAIKMFETWAMQDNDEFQGMPLGYVDRLVVAMAHTHLNPTFLSLLESRGSIADLVRELLKAGKDEAAMQLYEVHRDDIVDDLCKWAETDLHDGFRALKLFEKAGDKRANQYLNQHFSVADITRQKLTAPIAKPLLVGADNKLASPPRISDTANALIFSQSLFFRDLDSEARDRIWDLGKTQKYLRDAIIVEFGEKAQGAITVLEGEVTLYRRKGRLTLRVGTFYSGQTIGESWLVYALTSEVRVVASTNCMIHVAKRVDIQNVDGSLPQQVAARLARHLLERVKPGALATN